ERFWRRPRGNRKVALHFALETVEIGLQDRRLCGVGNGTETKFPARACLLQRDFSRGLGIAHPLSSSARRDQITFAVQFQQIDWRGVQLATLSSANLEQIVVGEA